MDGNAHSETVDQILRRLDNHFSRRVRKIAKGSANGPTAKISELVSEQFACSGLSLVGHIAEVRNGQGMPRTARDLFVAIKKARLNVFVDLRKRMNGNGLLDNKRNKRYAQMLIRDAFIPNPASARRAKRGQKRCLKQAKRYHV